MRVFQDNRGFMSFPLEEINTNLTQIIYVENPKKYTLRGLHSNPYIKRMKILKGKIFDVIINLNEEAENYLKIQTFILDREKNELNIPSGYAHGYVTLEENTEILYLNEGKFKEEEQKSYHYLEPSFNIQWPVTPDIISEKDNSIPFMRNNVLLYGSTGFLGSYYKLISGQEIINGKERLENSEQIEKEISKANPKYVVCASGLSGYPNTDWCDKNKRETLNQNVINIVNLVRICDKLNYKVIIFGSGGIFKNDREYLQDDKGNFDENFYNKSRIMLEELISEFENCVYLRICYPICRKYHPKNFLNKILNFSYVENVEMSFTILDDLFPKIEDLKPGIINFVNPGYINLKEIAGLFGEKEVREFKGGKSCPKIISPFEKDLDINLRIKEIVDSYKKDLGLCVKIDSCIACQSKNLSNTLDLGYQPLANNLKEIFYRFPLSLNTCNKCFHSQLTHQVDPNFLFSNYFYVSGISESSRKWFTDIYNHISKNYPEKFTKLSKVLDIGCNDGSQLDVFQKNGWETYGVDPAKNIIDSVRYKNHNLENSMWNENIAKKFPVFDVILAQNVFAHTLDVDSFLNCCRLVMDEESVLVIQTSQKDMFLNKEFDTIYHEHISFFNINSMNVLCTRNNFNLVNVSEHSIHGKSYIFEIKLKEKRDISSFIDNEIFLYDRKTYQNYSNCILGKKMENILKLQEYKNFKLVGYGSPAKATVFLNFYKDIKLDYVIEDNNLKIGNKIPGTLFEIFDIDKLRYEKENTIVFILAWNFLEDIIGKIKLLDNDNLKYLCYYKDNEITIKSV